MSYTCRNCNKEIRLVGDDDWFHLSGMYRCDGHSYNELADDWLAAWAVPVGVYGYIPSPFRYTQEGKPPLTEVGVTKPISPQRQLLLDAADTVDGERQDQYGNAEDSFAVIADYWETYLRQAAGNDQVIVQAKDVALMMVLFKIAREGNSPKRDNLLDLAGYAGLAQRIEETT